MDLQYTGDTDSDPVKVMDSNDVFVTDEGGNTNVLYRVPEPHL